MSTLLDVINAPATHQTKVASGGDSEFDQKRSEFYNAGWNHALAEVKSAAEAAANGGVPPEQEETEEERKARRKKEVMADMKNPGKKEEYKKNTGS